MKEQKIARIKKREQRKKNGHNRQLNFAERNSFFAFLAHYPFFSILINSCTWVLYDNGCPINQQYNSSVPAPLQSAAELKQSIPAKKRASPQGEAL